MSVLTGAEIDREVLHGPIESGCDQLIALSGYASPQPIYALLARERAQSVKVELTVGMVVSDGITLGAHRGFVALQTEHYPGRVRVGYVTAGRPVHAKLYVWCKNDSPVVAFAGSANLTQNGFEGGYREVVVPADPIRSLDYIQTVARTAQLCDDASLSSELIVLDRHAPDPVRGVVAQYSPWAVAGARFVEVSLLNGRTETGVAYGLNWGQRPRRDPDQSYLPVPAVVAREGFLPPRGKRFTLLARDGRALSAVIAQDGDKAIETPDSNAILGRFIRSQLGVAPGSRIDAANLSEAGVTGFRLYRVDEETYAIEFGLFG